MQTIKELTVFLANEAGALQKVAELLGANNINIEALTIQASTDHGVVRLIVSDPTGAQHLLENYGLITLESSVLGLRLTNRSGALADLAMRLARRGINIDYVYGSTEGPGEEARVYLRTADIEAARRALRGIESRGAPATAKAAARATPRRSPSRARRVVTGAKARAKTGSRKAGGRKG